MHDVSLGLRLIVAVDIRRCSMMRCAKPQRRSAPPDVAKTLIRIPREELKKAESFPISSDATSILGEIWSAGADFGNFQAFAANRILRTFVRFAVFFACQRS